MNEVSKVPAEETLRKRLLEFYCTIQDTDTPVAYDLTLGGSIKIIEWYNRLSEKIGVLDDGGTLVYYCFCYFQSVLSGINIFPKRKDDCYLLSDVDSRIADVPLDINQDFKKYCIKDAPLWDIPFAGLAYYQANCLPSVTLHMKWDALNLMYEWEKSCKGWRKYCVDEEGFYRGGASDLHLDLPADYCFSEQQRHIFSDLGLEGFFLDEKRKKNAVLFTKNFSKEEIPSSLCFSGQRGYLPVDESLFRLPIFATSQHESNLESGDEHEE